MEESALIGDDDYEEIEEYFEKDSDDGLIGCAGGKLFSGIGFCG